MLKNSFGLNNKWYRYLSIAAIVILMFFIGIKRELILVSLNKSLLDLASQQVQGHHNANESFISSPYFKLYFFKWFLTIAFTGIYLFFGCLSIYILFRKKAYIYWTILFFSSVFCLAFIFIFIGYLVNDYAMGYLFARKLMGLAQSPALLMILIPAFKLLKD